jgi:hypothetical protein
VRLAGIEPTTPWFVAKYSIQLSYSREAVDCSMVFFIQKPKNQDCPRTFGSLLLHSLQKTLLSEASQ